MRQRAAKKVYFNIALAIVLGFLIFFVFSKDYRAILDCLGNISAAGLLLLFAVETGYQLLESGSTRSQGKFLRIAPAAGKSRF